MFEYDICLCGNAEKCPKQDTCKRAYKGGPGIYTISLFYKEGQQECEYYWDKRRIKNGKD